MRRLQRAARVNGAAVPIAVVATSLVVGAMVLPRYPRPTFVPAGIVAGLNGNGETDPFYLAGSYSVSWTLEPASGAPCHLEATLFRSADRSRVASLVTTTALTSGDGTAVTDLAGAGYFIGAHSDCDWRVSLTPGGAPE